MKAATTTCLNPDCKRKARARALCFTCYMAARNLVNTAQTTWLAPEKAGKVNARLCTGPKSKTVDWLMKK